MPRKGTPKIFNNITWRKRTYVMDLVQGETIARLDIRTEGSSRKITYLIMPK